MTSAGGHLAAPGVVDADEQHLGLLLRAQLYPRIDAVDVRGSVPMSIDACQYVRMKPIATLAASCPPLLAGPLDAERRRERSPAR